MGAMLILGSNTEFNPNPFTSESDCCTFERKRKKKNQNFFQQHVFSLVVRHAKSIRMPKHRHLVPLQIRPGHSLHSRGHGPLVGPALPLLPPRHLLGYSRQFKGTWQLVSRLHIFQEVDVTMNKLFLLAGTITWSYLGTILSRRESEAFYVSLQRRNSLQSQ